MSDAAQQRTVLTRHFVAAFYDNDLVSPGSDLHGALAKFAALVVLPGIFYPVELLFKYTYPFKTFALMEAASWTDKATFVVLSLIVMGLATALEWDALQLDRRDGSVFGALPISARTIAEAKLSALGLFVLAVAGGLSAVGALTFPIIMHARWALGLGTLLQAVVAHVCATMGAGAFAFFALLSLNGLGQLCLGPGAFRRASAAFQMAVTFSLAIALLALPMIVGQTAAWKAASAGPAGWAPHLWFLGIYQWLSGQGDADWARLAERGAMALGLVALVGLSTTLLAYRRLLMRTVDAVQAGRPGRTIAMRVVDVIGWLAVRNPASRGFFSFTVATLYRSAWHRVTLAAFLGGALALSIAGISVSTLDRHGIGRVPMGQEHLLFVEFLMVTIVLAGVRAAAASPAELRSAWMLQMLSDGVGLRWLSGFRRAAWVAVIGPLIALLVAGVGVAAGWEVARTHAVAQIVFAGFMFDVMFYGFGRVPFACAFDGASGAVKVRWMFLVAFLTTALFSFARLVVFAGRSWRGSLVMLAVVAAAWIWIRGADARSIRRGGLRFEPDDEERTQTLDLSS